ncbi:hypothetical protein BS78_K075900 [Paspalum vaginatum]|uniref:Tc1-like transposase DDE domain-containing protein n=1 Tax=Paspalum vaginatum TaxID=158149 RepID=A0A9W7XF12_9POAL|nr:hypothetical protein BS78_K075900 [Paspalum vaginatum]
MEKWPAQERGATIFIQQDNAKTHAAVDDPVFCELASADGFDIRLMCQPPNSPDLNILDLGFFASLQSVYQKTSPKGVADIVQKVEEAYNNYSPNISNRIFLTHQSCMREIMRLNGSQHYPIPHLKKAALERKGILPISLTCDAEIVMQAVQYANE